MAPWSLALQLKQATADSPPVSGDSESQYVSLTEYYQVALIAPSAPAVVINFHVPSKLISHQHFLADIDACFSNMISFFNAEVTPDTLADLSRMSREILAGNPNRRVVPLWLVVRGEILLPSADAVTRYLHDFEDTFSAVTVAGRAGSPVTVTVFESLMRIRARPGEEDECPICMEALTNNDRSIVQTPCKHVYHQHCIVPWLKTNHTCPLCRSEIPRCIYVKL